MESEIKVPTAAELRDGLRSRITQLKQQLAVAMEALETIQERCVGFAAMLSKEALRQMGETK